jgi:hypothetical protein
MNLPRFLWAFGLSVVLLGIGCAGTPANAAQVRVAAGAQDRAESVISFPMPKEFGGPARLRRGEQIVPVQVDEEQSGWFILPSLPRGQTATWELEAPVPETRIAPAMQSRRSSGAVEIDRRGTAILRYQAEPGEFPRPEIPPQYRRGGYLHPLSTPTGRAVTDDFPANHLHHHGVWSPWTKTEFEGRTPDFWNMGDRKGRVDFVSLSGTTSGSVFAGFTSRHRFVDMLAQPEKAALEETWQVRAFNVGGTPDRPWNLFDLVITQTCSAASPLRLPKYHYGGLGFRGPWAWNGADGCRFLTSEGETNRVKANETRGRWCWIGGVVDGQTAGVVILCAPDNFRAPQPMRVHPSEPFFCFAPSQLGDWAIEPGKPYVARYRFVALDGEPKAEVVERLWRDYVEPPAVTVVSKP